MPIEVKIETENYSLTVTNEHPILIGYPIENSKKWKSAGHLHVGDMAQTLEMDCLFVPSRIKSVWQYQGLKRITLYNLSVEEDESYIANHFVIHNCRCNIIPVVGPDLAKAEKEGRIQE